jgi:hypothetical protein
VGADAALNNKCARKKIAMFFSNEQLFKARRKLRKLLSGGADNGNLLNAL